MLEKLQVVLMMPLVLLLEEQDRNEKNNLVNHFGDCNE